MYIQSKTPRPVARIRPRRGSLVVLAAVMMIVSVAILAFAVDIGYLCMARSQAQHCADAAALAAAVEMTSNESLKTTVDARMSAARLKAQECGALQDITRTVQSSSSTVAGSVIESVLFGHLDNPHNRNEQISCTSLQKPNVVMVRVSCDAATDNAVPVFFAKIFGVNSLPTSATAVAAFSTEKTAGFDKRDGLPCTLMPFVVLEDDWNRFLAQGTRDNWTYDPRTKTVTPGADGIPEFKMYPQATRGGSDAITPGNFGTVDIGNHNNSADELRRQIRQGPSADDLAAYDGVLRLDPTTGTVELTGAATLQLEGDPGLTACIKTALADVVGHPKTIMTYNHVVGQGDTTVFTISGFIGVRVVDYRMTGSMSSKYVLIQPAMVQDSSAIMDHRWETSEFVGQPVHLVR